MNQILCNQMNKAEAFKWFDFDGKLVNKCNYDILICGSRDWLLFVLMLVKWKEKNKI